jgi:TPP-dependent pyruvate/acetoin dehydrogenase alpha subunit
VPVGPELRPPPRAGPGAAAAADGAGTREGPGLLAAVSARTGGHLVSDVRQIYDAGQEHRDTHQPLRTPILLITALLFVADVFFRRVQLPRDD